MSRAWDLGAVTPTHVLFAGILGMLLSGAIIGVNLRAIWAYRDLSTPAQELATLKALRHKDVVGEHHHQRLHELAIDAALHAVRVRESSLNRERRRLKSSATLGACQFVLFALVTVGSLRTRHAKIVAASAPDTHGP